MATSTVLTNKPINPRGDDNRPVDSYNRASLYSGKALDFDGVNDYVDGGTLDITAYTQMSMSFYFKAHSTTSDWRLMSIRYSGSDDIRIFHATSIGAGKLSFALDDGTPVTFSEDFTKNEWYHVVMTHDGTTLTAYINGQEAVSAASDFNYSTADGELFLGAWSNGSPSLYYYGEMAGFKAFNTALTAAQVADLYNNPEKVVPTGVDNTALKLWLPMMEGAGTTAYDGSGNGNHGTISGATYVNGVGAPVSQSAVIDWNKGTNKAQYSEEFENSYWGLIDTQTPTANDTTAPDGQTTADKIVPSTNNAIHYIWNTSISLTGQNTISVFAKYNGYNIGIRPYGIGSGHAFANFDLQNGTILGSGGTSYDDSSITSFGDGWYRISMTMDNASTYGIIFYAVNGTTATELPTFTADGTSGFYLWGAQVNAGATLGPYVRTGAPTQPTPVLLPQGLTTGRDITGVNLFENVRKQGALNLDGNSWAEVHDNGSLDITTAITLEVWIKYDGIGDRGVLGKWYGNNKESYLLYTATNHRAVLYIFATATSSVASSTIMTTGDWYHIVGTYDGSNMKVYVNGTSEGTVAKTGNVRTTDKEVEIGRYYDSNTYAYQDSIAQPRIYNRALTAEEVQRSYDSGKNIYTNS